MIWKQNSNDRKFRSIRLVGFGFFFKFVGGPRTAMDSCTFVFERDFIVQRTVVGIGLKTSVYDGKLSCGSFFFFFPLRNTVAAAAAAVDDRRARAIHTQKDFVLELRAIKRIGALRERIFRQNDGRGEENIKYRRRPES